MKKPTRSTKILPIILSGGSGTRLWPLSTPEHPKQFLRLFNQHSLLQNTLLRVRSLKESLSPLIIGNAEHSQLLQAHLKEIPAKNVSIIAEPVGRNTAPAVALAALHAKTLYKDAILLILPADALIQKPTRFRQAILSAKKYAEQNYWVTFGIKPDRPETEYGYIEQGDLYGPGTYQVKQFVEKPNLKRAKHYLKTRRYAWNSGMFMCRASMILDELSRYAPEVLLQAKKTFMTRKKRRGVIALSKASYTKSPKISIDYAVMEKTKRVLVKPVDIGWSDVGSFEALYRLQKKDKTGNVISGNVLYKNVKNSYLVSTERPMVICDVDGMIAIEAEAGVCLRKGKGRG